jgi:hypothetical protein
MALIPSASKVLLLYILGQKSALKSQFKDWGTLPRTSPVRKEASILQIWSQLL